MADKYTSIGIVIDSGGARTGARQAEQAMDSVGRKADDMAAKVGGADKSLFNMAAAARAAAVALAGISIAAVGKSILDAGIQMERAEISLSLVTGSTKAANVELELLRARCDQLGISFASTLPAYASFMAATKGTAVEGDAARKVFDSVSKAVSVLGLSADNTQGVFTALQQMISKGKVSAEELRGQLGERLPGAFNLAAKAMGVTTMELDAMLQKGEVGLDLLPKLAFELDKLYDPKLGESSDSLAANINRMNNAFLELRTAIANSGLMEFANGAVKLATAFLTELTGILNGTSAAGHMLADAFDAAAIAAGTLAAGVAVAALVNLPALMTAAELAVVALGFAFKGSALAATALNAAIAAGPLLLLATALSLPILALDQVRDKIKQVTGVFLTLGETADLVWRKFKSWFGGAEVNLQYEAYQKLDKKAKELSDTYGIHMADAMQVVNGRMNLAKAQSLQLADSQNKQAAAAQESAKNSSAAAAAAAKLAQEQKDAKQAAKDWARDQKQAAEEAARAFARAKEVFSDYVATLEANTKSKQALLAGDKLAAEEITEQAKLVRQMGRDLTAEEVKILNQKLKVNQQITKELDDQKTAQEKAEKAAKDALDDQKEAARKYADMMNKPFENAAENIQQSFSDMFTNIFDGGLNSFEDFGKSLKSTFSRLLGELATLAIKQQVIVPVITMAANSMGMGNVGSQLAGQFGGMPNLGGLTGGSGGGAGGGGMPGMGSLFQSGGGSLFSSLTGGATLNGSLSGVLTQFGATRGMGEWMAMKGMGGASLGGIGMAGSLGYIGGDMLTKTLGMKGKYGGVGGSLGAMAGMAVGGPIGALIGGALGSLAGGLIGNSKPSDKFAGADFDLSNANVLSKYNKTGENVSNRDSLLNAALISRQQLMDMTGGSYAAGMTARVHVGSRDGIRVRAGNSGEVNVGVGNFQGAISTITSLMAQQLTGIPAELQAAIKKIDFSNLEAGFNDLSFAANLVNGKLFDPTPLNEYKMGLDAINAQFDEYAATAERLGLSISKVEEARAKTLAEFRKETLSPITDYLKSLTQSRGGLATPQEALATQQQTFTDLLAKAKNMDLAAIQQLPAAGQALIDLQRAFSASGQATIDTISMVQSALQDVVGTAQAPTSNPTVDAINTSSQGVVDELKSLKEIQQAQSDKISQLTQQIDALLNLGGNR